MLSTCDRCKTKRIKCDSGIPSCGNCNKAELECVSFDPVLRRSVSRFYIYSLNKRLRTLENLSNTAPSDFVSYACLLSAQAVIAKNSNAFSDLDILKVETESFGPRFYDTPHKAKLNFYLTHYEKHIYPQFAIQSFSKIPTDMNIFQKESFKTYQNLAAAISAASLSCKNVAHYSASKYYRGIVAKATDNLLMARNEESILVALLLLLYELFDPSAGLAWSLTVLASRLAVLFSWNTLESLVHETPRMYAFGEMNDARRFTLYKILYSFERVISMTFSVPYLLPVMDQVSPEIEACSKFVQTYNRLYKDGTPKNIDSASIETEDGEFQLLYLPYCDGDSFIHREIQERVFKAVRNAIRLVCNSTSTQSIYICPLVATPRMFLCGCIIVLFIEKDWITLQEGYSLLIKCLRFLVEHRNTMPEAQNCVDIFETLVSCLV